MTIMPKHLLSSVAVAACVFVMPATAGEFWLTSNEPRTLSLEAPVGSIVVGNPSVADVSVRTNQELVLFGKMPGLTKIYLFDEDGVQSKVLKIRVQSQRSDMVILQAGPTQYTFSCTTRCDQTFAVGDGTNESRGNGDTIQQQALTRFDMASKATNGSSHAEMEKSQLAAPTGSGDNPEMSVGTDPES